MRLKVFPPLLSAFFLLTVYSLVGQVVLLFMAMVLVLIPLLSVIFSYASLTGLRISRESPTRLYEGETTQVSLTVRNSSILPKFFLELADSLPSSLGEGTPMFASGLRPKQTIRASYPIRPEKRGVYPLGPVLLAASDPMGVVTLHRRVPVPGEILVYPIFPRLSRFSSAGMETIGASLSSGASASGSSLDFYNIRDYMPGDEFRRIHWKSTARTGSPKVVERERPSLSHVFAILYFPPGTNPGQGKHSPLEYAIKLTAGLAWAVVEAGGTFTLALPSQDGLPNHLTLKSRSRFTELLELLARVEEPSSPISPSPLPRFEGSFRRSRDIVVFAGEVDSSLSSALEFPRASGASVRLVTFDGPSFRPEENSVFGMAARLPHSLLRSSDHPIIVRKGEDLGKVLEEIAGAIRGS